MKKKKGRSWYVIKMSHLVCLERRRGIAMLTNFEMSEVISSDSDVVASDVIYHSECRVKAQRKDQGVVTYKLLSSH